MHRRLARLTELVKIWGKYLKKCIYKKKCRSKRRAPVIRPIRRLICAIVSHICENGVAPICLVVFSSPEAKAHKVSLKDGTRAGVRPYVHTFKREPFSF